MSLILESPRLVIRRLAHSDIAELVAYRSDPEVARYQSWSAMDEAEAERFIKEQQSITPFASGPGCQLALALRERDLLIGDFYVKVDSFEPRQVEIGYTLAREDQGYGYGTEALAMLLDHLFGLLNLHRAVAFTQCRNLKSVALLERLHWRREGHFLESIESGGIWHDEYLYAVLQREWLEKRAAPPDS